MFAAVIPAQNEDLHIREVINNLLQLSLDLIIPVVNGSQDQTLNICLSFSSPKLHILHTPLPLGIDIPRAAGAHFAYQMGAQGVLFIDGDMNGDLCLPLQQLINSIKSGTDCALTNCYPYIQSRHPLARKVLKYREVLNREINLFHQLGLASPSHGPHAISRLLLDSIPVTTLAIPPLEITCAQITGLRVHVAAAIPHLLLGSREKSPLHNKMVAETIIGDCLEALAFLKGTIPDRKEKGILYDGYHSSRRFDLLEGFLNDQGIIQIFHLGK
ncbi:glycosyltransferase family 2 protein [Dehalobacterium formicoaceticum]|uniref:Glycosyltransferase family 2 protein n=1 Tax=Dehalobacterium formicoaceticum TaxID=51515 RepID=A0ABT1Y2X7_9FIRM|nr:glycosyltransferase [Dehalobacterium formicoaceticum]MCR6545225.1 glycosyltransferase family 2 protein [Dehalobacterium formicoaceticum]